MVYDYIIIDRYGNELFRGTTPRLPRFPSMGDPLRISTPNPEGNMLKYVVVEAQLFPPVIYLTEKKEYQRGEVLA